MNVNNCAKRHNGVITWGFSQSDLGVWRHYRTMGICAALSAHWIKYHAHDDSLANHLGSGGVGRLNVGKLKKIAQDHRDMSNMKGFSQGDNLGLWLQMHGILTMHKSLNRFVWKRQGRIDVKTNLPSNRPIEEMGAGACPNIENDIVVSLKKYNTCYARINFGSQKAGHAVAVWLGQPTYGGGGDACFFDPNYGEFWFENKQDFFRFFPEYYRSKYKSWPLSFTHNWDVIPCAKKI